MLQDTSAFVFVIVMIVWFYTRICSLPVMIWHIFTEVNYSAEFSHFDPFIKLSGVFLSVMLALHCYWFMLFFKIIGKYIFEGEADDLQNKVTSAKTED